jgi:beta-barrel assembly-enhancing protease
VTSRPPQNGYSPDELDDQQLIATGARVDAHLVHSGLTFSDAALDEHLSGVMTRVAPTEARAVTVRVLRAPSVNAFVLPNGSIWIDAGLLAHLSDDAQLALVLAHEIAHLRRHHAQAALQERASKKVASQIAGLVLAPVGLADPASRALYSMMVAGYGRDRELEADRDGFNLVRAADMPVGSLPALFDTVDALRDESSPALYSDHPSNAARKAALLALMGHDPTASASAEDAMAFRSITHPAVIESIRLCLEYGKVQRALVEANAQLARDDQQPQLHMLRGEALRKLATDPMAHEMADAIAAYDRALVLEPKVAEAHRGLGYIALARGDKLTARRELQQYIDLAPQAADGRFVRALLAKEVAP